MFSISTFWGHPYLSFETPVSPGMSFSGPWPRYTAQSLENTLTEMIKDDKKWTQQSWLWQIWGFWHFSSRFRATLQGELNHGTTWTHCIVLFQWATSIIYCKEKWQNQKLQWMPIIIYNSIKVDICCYPSSAMGFFQKCGLNSRCKLSEGTSIQSGQVGIFRGHLFRERRHKIPKFVPAIPQWIKQECSIWYFSGLDMKTIPLCFNCKLQEQKEPRHTYPAGHFSQLA